MKFLMRLASVLLRLVITLVFAKEFGSFTGELVFRWRDDGRTMELTVPFSYKDPQGRVWDVPTGAVTDGASIPQIFWAYAGPYEGNHRIAAAVHDYYCRVRTRTWQDTHRVF